MNLHSCLFVNLMISKTNLWEKIMYVNIDCSDIFSLTFCNTVLFLFFFFKHLTNNINNEIYKDIYINLKTYVIHITEIVVHIVFMLSTMR